LISRIRNQPLINNKYCTIVPMVNLFHVYFYIHTCFSHVYVLSMLLSACNLPIKTIIFSRENDCFLMDIS
jgi:hypothetical protein